jgi:hypothetical protein
MLVLTVLGYKKFSLECTDIKITDWDYYQNLVSKYIKVMFSFLIIELKMFSITHCFAHLK